jgi:hypothetical protein
LQVVASGEKARLTQKPSLKNLKKLRVDQCSILCVRLAFSPKATKDYSDYNCIVQRFIQIPEDKFINSKFNFEYIDGRPHSKKIAEIKQ